MSSTRLTIGDVRDPDWRSAVTRALRELGARRLWHAGDPDVDLWWYLVGWRVVAIEWDRWTGLSLRGPAAAVARLGDAARPHALAPPPR